MAGVPSKVYEAIRSYKLILMLQSKKIETLARLETKNKWLEIDLVNLKS